MTIALLLAALCTPLPVCGSSQPAPVALVQSVGADLGVTASARLALPSPTTDGSAAIVAVRAGAHSAHALTASDSQGNPYTLVAAVTAPGPSTLAMFYAPRIAAGPLTVTITDTATAGPIRMIVREYGGLGALGPAVVSSGSGTTIPATGKIVAAVTLGAQSSCASSPAVEVDAVTGKLFMLDRSALLIPSSSSWTSLSVDLPAESAECATPTPVLAWDRNPGDENIESYSVWRRQPGGVLQRERDFPCEGRDYDEDGIAESEFCRGADLGIPLQRYCPTCAPLTMYEFAVKARDKDGRESATFSNIVSVCFPRLCVPPGPCS